MIPSPKDSISAKWMPVQDAMKKKTGATAPRAAKTPQKRGGRSAKLPLPRAEANQPRRMPRSPAAPNDAKPTIRRLQTATGAGAQARSRNWRPRADTDFLLDIPNRRGFERELHRAIAYIKRYRASGALIVLDVDRLKPINDAFGHAAGDQVLKAIVADAAAPGALLRRGRPARRRRVRAAVVESQRDRRQGQGGVAGGGRSIGSPSRFAAAPLPRAHPPASPFSSPHAEAGRALEASRQRDVCAQGAAPA